MLTAAELEQDLNEIYGIVKGAVEDGWLGAAQEIKGIMEHTFECVRGVRKKRIIYLCSDHEDLLGEVIVNSMIYHGLIERRITKEDRDCYEEDIDL